MAQKQEEAQKFLAGKKTYIAAGILFLTALMQFADSGTIDVSGLQTLAASLGLIGLRKAL